VICPSSQAKRLRQINATGKSRGTGKGMSTLFIAVMVGLGPAIHVFSPKKGRRGSAGQAR
jgi:hypothetical protein